MKRYDISEFEVKDITGKRKMEEEKIEPSKKGADVLCDSMTGLNDDFWKIFYDPETDLDLLELDEDSDNYEFNEKLINKMFSLWLVPGEKYVYTDSLQRINQTLNSPDSVLIKTGILFILCQDLLEGLQSNRVMQICSPILVNLIFNGISELLIRFLHAAGSILINIYYYPSYIHHFLEVEKDFIRFEHLNLDVKKTKNLSKFGPVAVKYRYPQTPLYIELEDIKKVISYLLPFIPYKVFLVDYITPFLKRLSLLKTKQAITIPASQTSLYRKYVHYDLTVGFFNSMKEPFLIYKKRILAAERERLFKDFTALDVLEDPDKPIHFILKIIHDYVDSRAVCFFTKGRSPELVDDPFFPQDQSKAPG